MSGPHLVILGAGASKAALPNGDSNGIHLPVMEDFLEIVPSVKEALNEGGILIESKNLEEIYSRLVALGRPDVQARVESLICNFFEGLSLPDHPTLYDHLLLSLREKDVIATFNWDPFLLQALQRNLSSVIHPPQILFLHGNVMVGSCNCGSVKSQGFVATRCPSCMKFRTPSKLLYPVREKDYEQDPMIATTWRQFRQDLQQAFMITVFGYSAPQSDTAAIKVMKEAVGPSQSNRLKMLEIIDIKPREEVLETWEPFIQKYNYHYKIHHDFYDSYIPKYPRRTGTIFIRQYLEGTWISPNPIPRDLDLEGLSGWIKPLLAQEGVEEAN